MIANRSWSVNPFSGKRERAVALLQVMCYLDANVDQVISGRTRRVSQGFAWLL
jgi:hypothetical protein